MPGAGIMRAKRLRAGALGQSSRFYNIYGQRVSASAKGAFKGGQGWTAHNPSIGSMLSLGIAKQNKNAGGNNVCQPGPGPKKTCPELTANNIMTVGTAGSGPTTVYGYGAPGSTTPAGGLTPQYFVQDLSATVVFIYWIPTSNQFEIVVNYSGLSAPTQTSAFETISFVNCDNQSVRTYSSASASTFDSSTITNVQWAWTAATPQAQQQENAFWTSALGKNIKVVFNSTSQNIVWDYCCNNNDCKCRGPLAQCPCRKGGC